LTPLNTDSSAFAAKVGLETHNYVAIARLDAPCFAVAVTDDNRIVAGTSTGEVLFFDVRGL